MSKPEAKGRHYITKSRSGHYTVTVRFFNGRKATIRKIDHIVTARRLAAELVYGDIDHITDYVVH